ncbi:MAG: RagB/SusD family nutrient uptake outer membrane protein [Pedobacter sp.]|uniref:RagB/SusD family nutrient uptake outer membrane protein n=1 Tax=Pedobacter sp. TaxID=1411316 RepID=UPI003394884B
MKQNIIYILLITVLLAGCKKLDGPDHSTLTTEAVLNTSRDLDNLLYGAYSAVANDNALAGYWRIFPEVLADHVDINVIENLPADPYKLLYDRNMAQAQYAQSWKLGYTAIQNANLVIYAIENKLVTKEKDPEFSDFNRDRIEGESRFIRALAYFEMVRFYGHQYGYNSGSTNSGIVLRVKPAINVTNIDELKDEARATVEAVYLQIITDLKAAETLIPSGNDLSRRGRASNYAAAAILARVYFQMNDYQNAMTEINKVIGAVPGTIQTYPLSRSPLTGPINAAQAAANVLTPFNTSSTGTTLSTETIFDFVSVVAAPVNGAISRKYLRTAVVEPHLSISNAFLADAVFGVTDARKVGLITTVGVKSYSRKYDRLLENIPVIRSAELILDRAEINAMNAVADPAAHAAAVADLNVLRDRAIPAYVPATTITINAATILGEVKKERIRELAFEGDRLHNLRRMRANIGPGSRAGVAPEAWNSNKLLFKIPDAEIRSSPNIVQNPD